MYYISGVLLKLNSFKTVKEVDGFMIQAPTGGTLSEDSFVLFDKDRQVYLGDENGFFVFDDDLEAEKTINQLKTEREEELSLE